MRASEAVQAREHRAGSNERGRKTGTAIDSGSFSENRAARLNRACIGCSQDAGYSARPITRSIAAIIQNWCVVSTIL